LAEAGGEAAGEAVNAREVEAINVVFATAAEIGVERTKETTVPETPDRTINREREMRVMISVTKMTRKTYSVKELVTQISGK